MQLRSCYHEQGTLLTLGTVASCCRLSLLGAITFQSGDAKPRASCSSCIRARRSVQQWKARGRQCQKGSRETHNTTQSGSRPCTPREMIKTTLKQSTRLCGISVLAEGAVKSVTGRCPLISSMSAAVSSCCGRLSYLRDPTSKSDDPSLLGTPE